MQFQGLLLCAVILFSLFAAPLFQPIAEPIDNSQKIAVESTAVGDLHSGFSKRQSLLEKGFSEKFAAAEKMRHLTAALVSDFILGNAGTGAQETNENDKPEAKNNAAPESNISASLCDSINPEEISAKAALMKELAFPNGATIFELNSKKRWPIASLSKLMTGVIAAEKLDWNREAVISEKAVESEGSAGNFKAGEIFTVGDLIKAMLTVSSNDAAVAVAETLGENEFVNAMQSKAAELRMFQTTYMEPSGLSVINQSTASDLAKLVDYIRQNHSEFLEISRQKKTTITELKTKRTKTLININQFAGQTDFIGDPPKRDEARPKIEFLGGKTGYIDEAGRNIIALFDVQNRKILTIVLGAENSYKETKRLLKCIK